jgi:hypothetical protein
MPRKSKRLNEIPGVPDQDLEEEILRAWTKPLLPQRPSLAADFKVVGPPAAVTDPGRLPNKIWRGSPGPLRARLAWVRVERGRLAVGGYCSRCPVLDRVSSVCQVASRIPNACFRGSAP